MYTISTIETAILETLKTSLSGSVVKFGTLADFMTHDLDSIALRTPAVYVVYERGEYKHGMSAVQDRHMTFSVIAVVRNVRGNASSRHGLTIDPEEPGQSETGVYDVLDSIRSTLSNSSCSLSIDPLIPVEESAISGSKSLSIYGITFETRCRDLI